MPKRALPGLMPGAGWSHPYPAAPWSPLYADGGQDDGDEGAQDDADDESDGDGTDDSQDGGDETAKWRDLARKHEKRAKENASAARELARLRREGMSDVDKRVDEAVAAARAEERVKSGERVARSAFLAAATGRMDNAKDVADDVNLRRYVDEDGEVDEDGIADLVNRLAPKNRKSDTDDETDDGRDTRGRRTRARMDQGTRRRRNGSSGGATVQDGIELYKELLGGGSNHS